VEQMTSMVKNVNMLPELIRMTCTMVREKERSRERKRDVPW
jgi:hypothetical protein